MKVIDTLKRVKNFKLKLHNNEKQTNNKLNELIEIAKYSDEDAMGDLLQLKEFDWELLKQIFAKYSNFHKAYISKKFPDKKYIATIDEISEKYKIDEGGMVNDIHDEYMILRDKETGKRYATFFIPSITEIKKEYDEIAFMSSSVYNYYFQSKKALEKGGLANLDLTDLLQYIENANISDFHIEAQDLMRYEYSARYHGGKASKAVIIEKNVRKDVVENLIHQARLMANKDTLEEPPEQSMLIKTDLTDNKGKTIERTFRVNIMKASKPPHRVDSIVIRRLKNLEEIKALGFKGLGYTDKAIEILENIMKAEIGINVVAGATNSGKSTLLSLITNILKERNYRILSIENPIEIIAKYPQFDLSQYETADEKHKLTRKKAMKGFLRHDPDIVLLSEIRDEEIPDFIDLGLRAHVAYSTIHAGKVTDVILRLLQATPNPLDVINSLNGIIVQSLIPKICQKCGGKGCDVCNGTGEGGSVPVYEIAHFKNLDVSKLITSDGKVDFQKFFDFKALAEEGRIDYISKKEVAKELFEKGIIFEKDYKDIVEKTKDLV